MQCPHCTLRYNNSLRLPLLAPCSHTLCQKCIPTLKFCPICRQKIPNEYRNNSLSQAKNINYALLKAIQHSLDNIDKFIKICFVGDTGVGKSSLIRMLKDQKFQQTLPSTVGFDFAFADRIIDGYKVRFQLWDSAGQQKFRSIVPLHYKNAHAVIIVYDVSKNDPVQNWIKQTLQHASLQTQIILVGNKIDIQQGRISKILTVRDWELFDQNSKDFLHVLTSCSLQQGKQQLWRALEDVFQIMKKRNINKLSKSFFGESFSIHLSDAVEQDQKKICCN